MDRSQWLEIVARLNASWPGQQIEPPTAAEWYTELAHLEAGDIWLAIRELRREQQWRPSLAEILGGVKLYRTTLAAEARHLELEAAGRHRGVPMPPETRQAAEILADTLAGKVDKQSSRQMIETLAARLAERTGTHHEVDEEVLADV